MYLGLSSGGGGGGLGHGGGGEGGRGTRLLGNIALGLKLVGTDSEGVGHYQLPIVDFTEGGREGGREGGQEGGRGDERDEGREGRQGGIHKPDIMVVGLCMFLHILQFVRGQQCQSLTLQFHKTIPVAGGDSL